MDALIVLGGGVYPDKTLPEWIKLRLKLASELYHQGAYEYVIASGKGRSGTTLIESEAMAAELIKLNVPEQKIYQEPLSSSTFENAYFCRTIHTDPLRIKKITVVTNNFHSQRAQKIFYMAYGANTSFNIVATVDSGLSDKDLNLLQRCDIEQANFVEMHILPNIESGNLKQLHDFIFNKDNELAILWHKYKQTNELYKATSNLMLGKIENNTFPI